MPVYGRDTTHEQDRGISSTLLTIIAIVGGIVGTALLLFFSRRLYETAMAIREALPHAMRQTNHPGLPPPPYRLPPAILDSFSGFVVVPLATAIARWTRSLLRRPEPQLRAGVSRQRHSVQSDESPMMELGQSTLPRQVLPPSLAHLAGHHNDPPGEHAYSASPPS